MSRAAIYVGTAPVLYLDSAPTSWVRPAWPALADITSLNNRFTAVYGVENSDSNFVSLLAQTSSGTYTVDWGDGTIDSGIVSNVQANHTYNYATIAASVVGEFKPVVVTVTTSGGNITTFNLQRKNPLNTPSAASRINWLDIAINASAMTTLAISAGPPVVRLSKLQQVKIYNNSVTNMSSMFHSCRSLQSVYLFNTASATNMTAMFQNCSVLQSIPLFNTSAVTTMGVMFANCSSLQTVPLFNTSAVTNMSGMFGNCYSLQSIPLFNTASVQFMGGMFNSCYSLQSVPLFNTGLVQDMYTMFQDCHSLQSVPLFNTVSVGDMSFMFDNCYCLQSVPLFNTVNVLDMTNMFYTCRSLKTVPLFNTSQVNNMSSMFLNCEALESVPLFVTTSLMFMTSMFLGCVSLQSIPLFNIATVTFMSNAFEGCSSLQSVPLFNTASIDSAAGVSLLFNLCSSLCQGRTNGIRFAISYVNCKLSTAALNDIFTGLGTASGSQTITVTGNPGAATCNTSIATAKGWTVAI